MLATCLGWNAETIAAIAGCFAALALGPTAWAAVVAAKSFQLESNPYIVVSPGDEIKRKAEASGTPLHEIPYEILSVNGEPDNFIFRAASTANRETLADRAMRTGAATIVIAARNIGRSPAVRLWLTANLARPPRKESIRIIFAIDALPPGDAIITVSNYSAVAVDFAVIEAAHDPRERKLGTRVTWNKRKLPLASLAIFRIRASHSPISA